MKPISVKLLPAIAMAATAAFAQGPRPHGFPAASTWTTDFAFAQEFPAVGDFNGDGLDDIATFLRSEYGGATNGDVRVALNILGAFGTRSQWADSFCFGDELPVVGDFNGDGKDDIARLLRDSAGAVFVALSNGTSFGSSQLWAGGFATNGKPALVGDFNGDGKDDLAEYNPSTGVVRVALAQTGDFAPASIWLPFVGSDPDARVVAGDFDGDGRDDVACFLPTTTGLAKVRVALSNGSGFNPPSQWLPWIIFVSSREAFAHDFDGDGIDDIATLNPGGGVSVAQSDGGAFAFDNTNAIWNSGIRHSGELCLTGRFNRDLNGDLAIFTRGGLPAPALGDVRVSLCGDHAPPKSVPLTPFGYATIGKDILPPPEQGGGLTELPLVLGLIEFGDRAPFGDPLGRDKPFFEDLFFGPSKPNQRDYFLEMSKNTFTFSNAGVVWATMPEPIESIPDPNDPNKTIKVDTRPYMIQKMADVGFDFRPFDTNGDGIVKSNELCIALVSNYDDAGGQTYFPYITIEYPSGGNIDVWTGVASADHLGRVDLYAHELAHLLGTADIYSSDCYNEKSTLQHCNGGLTRSALVHLDPWHKMLLGWGLPTVYDINDGPGMALLDAAQLTTGSALLLYDSERGTDEYYMLEFRSKDCNLADQIWQSLDPIYRAPNIPAFGYKKAGYDSDVAGRGIVPWYCRMKPTGGPDEGIAKIRPGDDDVLDTAVDGDDILVANDRGSGMMIIGGPDGIFQSDPKHRIEAGPDGILQTTPGGDDLQVGDTIFAGPNLVITSTVPDGEDDVKIQKDELGHDWAVFISTDPQDVLSRGLASNYLGVAARADLSWRGSAAGIAVTGGENSENWSYVQWGRVFRPFLAMWPDAPQSAGGLLTVQGKFGIRPAGESVVGIYRSVDNGTLHQATPVVWAPTIVTLEIPEDLPPGHYQVYFAALAGSSTEIISNVIPITIEDDYERWREQIFADQDLIDKEISGPTADYDFDGLSTLAEYAHGGDPYSPDPGLLPWIELTASGFRNVAPLLASHPGVIVTVSFSIDLTTWADNGLYVYEEKYLGNPDLVLAGNGRSFVSAGPRFFSRFKYTLVTP